MFMMGRLSKQDYLKNQDTGFICPFSLETTQTHSTTDSISLTETVIHKGMEMLPEVPPRFSMLSLKEMALKVALTYFPLSVVEKSIKPQVSFSDFKSESSLEQSLATEHSEDITEENPEVVASELSETSVADEVSVESESMNLESLGPLNSEHLDQLISVLEDKSNENEMMEYEEEESISEAGKIMEVEEDKVQFVDAMTGMSQCTIGTIDVGVGDSEPLDWIDCAVGDSQHLEWTERAVGSSQSTLYKDSSTAMSQEEEVILAKPESLKNTPTVSIYENVSSTLQSPATSGGSHGFFVSKQRRVLGEINVVPDPSSILQERKSSSDRFVPLSSDKTNLVAHTKQDHADNNCGGSNVENVEPLQMNSGKRVLTQPMLRIGLSKRSRVPPLHPRPTPNN